DGHVTGVQTCALPICLCFLCGTLASLKFGQVFHCVNNATSISFRRSVKTTCAALASSFSCSSVILLLLHISRKLTVIRSTWIQSDSRRLDQLFLPLPVNNFSLPISGTRSIVGWWGEKGIAVASRLI